MMSFGICFDIDDSYLIKAFEFIRLFRYLYIQMMQHLNYESNHPLLWSVTMFSKLYNHTNVCVVVVLGSGQGVDVYSGWSCGPTPKVVSSSPFSLLLCSTFMLKLVRLLIGYKVPINGHPFAMCWRASE